MTTGAKVGPYSIVAPLGAGGMGEVYRAHDTRLGRDVALKVLPEAFARDAERMARFEREAHLLASLNHPHIAAIYGLEEADGRRYLVLELVEGETLAERVVRGPLPLEDALSVCGQIAEALEAAHEKGIIHRDLKPSNVKVTPEGKVKVLDFGLAKAFAGEAAVEDISKSPTLTSPATQMGALLGTAAYMSPEQARGRAVDRRADIWAFGCVLYELLTGKQAFSGETVSDTVASVLKTEPDWSVLPTATPPGVRRLVRRCLEKDAKRRLRDIADAWLQMEEALHEPAPTEIAQPLPLPAVPRWQQFLPRALAGALLLVTLALSWGWWQGRRSASPEVTRFAVAVSANVELWLDEHPAVAISPDGKHLIFVAASGGTRQLFLRALDRLQASPVPGTEGAQSPFFSPDGQWVGFFAEGKLKKVSINGGAAVTLCTASGPRGASWGADDNIYFAPEFSSGLSRVSAAGGTPQLLTTPDAKQGERTHRWPEVLPGGKAVVFTIGALNNPDYYLDAQLAVLSLDTLKTKILPLAGTNARYAPSGHLVFARVGGLFAVPFDLKRLEAAEKVVPVLENVALDSASGAVHFTVSRTGSLVYVPGTPAGDDRVLVWKDRKGTSQPTLAPPRRYEGPRLSPDGRRLALTVFGPRNPDVWVYDFARGTLTRLTFEGSNFWPLWTPDGKRIVFVSDRPGGGGLFWRAADGSAPEERLTSAENTQDPNSWTPDGKLLIYSEVDPKTNRDLWILPLEGERKPQPFLRTQFNEWAGALSPDGRWLAYASNESGRREIYVQPFPGPGGKWQISTEGGDSPAWSRSGRELFYRGLNNKMMRVSVTTQPIFTAGTPEALFSHSFVGFLLGSLYDVSPDGQRFILVQAGLEEKPSTEMYVVLNWTEELNRQATPGRP